MKVIAQYEQPKRSSVFIGILLLCVVFVSIAGATHFHRHTSNQPQNEHCGVCLHIGHLLAVCLTIAVLLSVGVRREFVRIWEISAEQQGIMWLPCVRPPPVL